ncbi:hypothetical protein [Herbiconiux sp. YIM B11900]|uniref:hypothetical protein n=1 Tax=Herbiconiux sp. YIM B11900 TaxID=3404131 RepID=UPI003F825690
MRSRESRRRERRIAARMAEPVLLLAGDPGEVLDALREDAAKFGIPVVAPRPGTAPGDAVSQPGDGAASAGDAAVHPTVAVVVAQVGDGQSSLRRGLRMLDREEDRLRPETVRIVVILAGASRVLPRRVRDALAPEILYQVESGLYSDEHSRPWRTLRLRSGQAVLRALGIRVFRVPAPPS